MNKIPFDIKYRPQIESGEYKVETGDGYPARIICWDSPIDEDRPIICIVYDNQIEQYKVDGRYDRYERSNYDLIIITPEPELTEFEEAVRACAFGKLTNKEEGETKEEYVKRWSAEPLSLARKELQPEIDAEVEKAYKNADRMQYEKGKEDALNDRPTWKKCKDGNTNRLELEALCREAGSPIEIAFRANGYRIFLSDLEKLPKG